MSQSGNRFSQQRKKFYQQIEEKKAIANEIFPPTSSTHKSILPWYWRKLPLGKLSGAQVFQTLFLQPPNRTNHNHNNKIQQIATLLESPANSTDTKLARYSLCAGSPRIIKGKPQLWTPPLGEILPFLSHLLGDKGDKLITTNPQSAIANLPFTGGWLGWLGYDLAWEIEQLPQQNTDSLPFPIAYWYEPESFAILEHEQQILWLAATDFTQLDLMQNKLENLEPKTPNYSPNQPENSVSPIFQMSQQKYENAVKKAQKYIQAGDIFQANLSLRFETETSVDSWSIYQALQQINPSPFASYWQTPWGAVISCSPERLIKLLGNQVETRPIAGTRSRGITLAEDEKLAQELISNSKERAEHIMLVDLERNDLGRVCEWGTVKVDELLTIEKYSHVMHLVSNVIGKLDPNCDAIDLIRAVFPGGTITGCPKVRCLEIIEELEPVKRNLFYGSCGYLDWRGNLDLNIFIRTLLYAKINNSNQAKIWGQIGAGIVADSDPKKEWLESLQKAQAQLKALNIAII
ncbi:MAG: anthranilate synthase component I [Oscillatoria sp. PMC 1051.18]|nr:anthranilate synthase component I [Oscillatoria sp. PMC 1050.18]MEC5028412.1 anthranilate synthase component I [Oscillatoria sp. PMC 1051.18]